MTNVHVLLIYLIVKCYKLSSRTTWMPCLSVLYQTCYSNNSIEYHSYEMSVMMYLYMLYVTNKVKYQVHFHPFKQGEGMSPLSILLTYSFTYYTWLGENIAEKWMLIQSVYSNLLVSTQIFEQNKVPFSIISIQFHSL